MLNQQITKKIKVIWISYRSIVIASIVVFFYALIVNNSSIVTDSLFSTSINCLSILFGFNMVVVTHYYTNSDFNKFLKKINIFNSFKNKYKQTIKVLIVSLISIYILSLFEKADYCFWGIISFSKLSNYVVVFLSLLNLVKAYDCVAEFFNVYGSTYSNTMENINNN